MKHFSSSSIVIKHGYEVYKELQPFMNTLSDHIVQVGCLGIRASEVLLLTLTLRQCQQDYTTTKTELSAMRGKLAQEQGDNVPLAVAPSTTGPALSKSGYLFVRSSGHVR